MSKAPERIWADPPTTFDGMDIWHEEPCDVATEYVRADLYAAQAAEIARLTAERDAAMAKAFCMGRDAAANEADEIAMWLLDNEYDDCADGAEDAAAAIRALTPPADLAARIGGAA